MYRIVALSSNVVEDSATLRNNVPQELLGSDEVVRHVFEVLLGAIVRPIAVRTLYEDALVQQFSRHGLEVGGDGLDFDGGEDAAMRPPAPIRVGHPPGDQGGCGAWRVGVQDRLKEASTLVEVKRGALIL
jgi:hypothetical protein